VETDRVLRLGAAGHGAFRTHFPSTRWKWLSIRVHPAGDQNVPAAGRGTGARLHSRTSVCMRNQTSSVLREVRGRIGDCLRTSRETPVTMITSFDDARCCSGAGKTTLRAAREADEQLAGLRGDAHAGGFQFRPCIDGPGWQFTIPLAGANTFFSDPREIRGSERSRKPRRRNTRWG